MNNRIPLLLGAALVAAVSLAGCGRETPTTNTGAPNAAAATDSAAQTQPAGDIDADLWPCAVTCDGYAKADSETQEEIRFRLMNYYTAGANGPTTKLSGAIQEACAESDGASLIGKIVDWRNVR